MAALCAGFAFHGLEHLFEGPSLAAATNLAYPVGDLLLLGIVAGSSVVVAGRSRATLVLIAIGLAVNAAGDTFNFVGSSGSRSARSSTAIAWPTSILVIAMSMWVGDGRRPALRAASAVGRRRCPGSSPSRASSSSSPAAGTTSARSRSGSPRSRSCSPASGSRSGPALRLAREQLRSSEERYRLLFERNPQPMVAYDRETLQIVAVSDAMVASYGYSREELLRDDDRRTCVPPEDVAALLAFLASNPDGSRARARATRRDYPRPPPAARTARSSTSRSPATTSTSTGANAGSRSSTT